MKKGFFCCFIIIAIIAIYGTVSASDDFGIPTYPGAKSDSDTKEVCAVPMLELFRKRQAEAGLTSTKHCYRTNDSFNKVVEFYKKQKGLEGGVGVNEGDIRNAGFCLSKGEGCTEVSVGTSVNIEAPWFVPSSMKMNNDLLIVITDTTKK